MRIVIACAALMLAGCVTDIGEQRLVAALQETVSEPVAVDSPLYQAIGVHDVSGGRIGDPDPFALVRNDQFREYMTSVLTGRGMVAEGEPIYDLDARIVRIGHPPFAMNRVDVTAVVEYTLIRRADQEELFTTTVEEQYSASVQDSPYYPSRQALGAAASMSKNISTLADQLEAAFPAPPAAAGASEDVATETADAATPDES